MILEKIKFFIVREHESIIDPSFKPYAVITDFNIYKEGYLGVSSEPYSDPTQISSTLFVPTNWVTIWSEQPKKIGDLK